MNIQFHLTNLCNLRCKHCYQADYNPVTVSLSDFVTILAKTYSFFESKHDSLNELMLTGGEPLCIPNIADYLFAADSYCKKLILMTNGLLLNPEKLNFFRKACHFCAVQVSLEGPEEINDKIRGLGTFKKIRRVIHYINDAGLKSSVSCTLAPYNYDKIEDLYHDLVKKDSPHMIWFDRCIPFRNTDVLTKEQFMYFLQSLQTIRRCWEQENLPTFPSADRALQWLSGEDVSLKYACRAGLFHYTVMYNGDVMLCRRLNFVVGNLLKESWDDIIERVIPLLKQMHSIPDDCLDCKQSVFCHGGLKCLTYALFKDFNKKDINCPL